MKNTMKHFARFGALVVAVATVLSIFIGVGPVNVCAAEDDSILYTQDFSGDTSDLGCFTVEDGVARPVNDGTGNAVWTYTFPEGMAVESNNYELSFDVRLGETANSTNFFVHFLDLAGGPGGNSYMSLEGNGAWVCNCTTVGGWATTGTGSPTNYLHGSMIEESVNLMQEEFTHVRYVHYNGIIEVWINDVRYVVQSLKNIGNNAWSERYSVSEGTISGFMFHFMGITSEDPSFYFDNVVLKEIKDLDDITYTETVSTEESVNKIFNNEISGARLGREAYTITAEYTVKNTVEGAETVAMELCGLNGLTGTDSSGDNYTVTFSAKVENGSIIPSLNWYDTGVKEHKANAIELTGDKITMKVEVSGTKLICSINGTVVIEGEFVKDFGMYKGDFQTLSLVNSENIVWTSVEYTDAAESIAEVTVKGDKSVASTGEEITFTATYKPEDLEPSTIEWHVNGVKVEGADELTYVMTQAEAGTYKVSCVIDGVESANCFVVIKEAETPDDDNQNTQTPDDNQGQNENNDTWIIIAVIAAVVVVAAVVVAVVIISKKRKS